MTMEKILGWRLIVPAILLLLLAPSVWVCGQDAIVSQPGHSLKLLKTSNGSRGTSCFILTDDHRYDALGFSKSAVIYRDA